MNSVQFKKSDHFNKMKEYVHAMNSLRLDKDRPTDVTFKDYILEHTKLSVDDFYTNIGVDPAFDTIQNLFTTPDSDIRWLIPEIFRDALRLGYRSAPIWPNITASEEQVNGLTQILPYINPADATPKRVGEAETIPVGTLTYGSKSFSIHKFGRGIKITDEVQRYVSLAVLSIYLQDFGLKMGYGVDALAINCLINGEQANGSEAAPVIGTATGSSVTFKDILKIWIRMAKIGRMPKLFIGAEDIALDVWDLTEFKTKYQGTTDYTLNVKTPLPQGADYYIQGGIAANTQLIVDPTAALLKMNAVPLTVESERIVSNQTEAFYASFTLGFAKLFTDACVIQDRSKTFENYPFPAAMDFNSQYATIMD